MTRTKMVKVAQQEIRCWRKLPPGLVMAILFAFIHRVTTGETVEETFFKPINPPPPDYEI